MNENMTAKAGGSFLANMVKAGLSNREEMRQAPIEDLMKVSSESVEETLPDIEQIQNIPQQEEQPVQPRKTLKQSSKASLAQQKNS